MANFYLDLCLSDIPKERIKTAANGKKYLKCIVKPRKEMDRDGYDHYVAVFIPSAERQDGQGPAFIGRAQEKHYEDDHHTGGTPFQSKNENEDGDLPF